MKYIEVLKKCLRHGHEEAPRGLQMQHGFAIFKCPNKNGVHTMNNFVNCFIKRLQYVTQSEINSREIYILF